MRISFILLLLAGALSGADHRGTVKLAGVPVQGASVTAKQGEKKITAMTDDQGAYSLPGLADGQWTLRVEMLCFVPQEKQVEDAAPVTWEMKLMELPEIQAAAAQAGSSSLSVSFGKTTASASAATPVPAPAPAVQAKKGKFQKTDLRASADLPAVAPQENEAPKDNASDSFLVNGSVNNSAASSMGQSAAFGNQRKGRGPRYQAALGSSLGNSALDARTFSLTGQQVEKPAYNHFQGQASFGGPVVIPHLIPLSQRPANFFVSYQWMRNRTGSTQSSLMPTAAERAGDLSQSMDALGRPLTILDPSTGAPFAGNRIPLSRISPQAKSLLELYPLPNFSANSRFNYQVPIVGRSDSDTLQSRLGKTITAKDQINGALTWQRNGGENTSVFGFRDTNSSNGINTNVNWSHRLAQRMFTNLRLEYSRSSSRLTPYFANVRNVSGEAGVSGNNQDPLNWGPPALSFASGYEALNDGVESFVRSQTTGIGASMFWNHGTHNVHVGADVRRLQTNALGQQNPRGSFGFTGAGTGSDFGNFLLGTPDTSAIAFGNADKYFRSGMYDTFVTDDVRLRPGFTVTAGMRWEYGSPIRELYGRLVNLDIAPGFRAVAPVVANSPVGSLTGRHYADSLLEPTKNGFQPRLAIAWRPFLASSMVIRAGYGIYYDTSVYQWIANRMAQQSPLSKSLSVQNSAENPLTLANGFLSSPATTTNTFAIDPNFRVGYAQIWNASIQRDLPGALVAIATYSGTKGNHAQQQFLPNTAPGDTNPCTSCPVGFAYLTSDGSSIRHSGQIQVRRRLHNGITASVNYTYSKSIDDAALGGKNQSSAVVAQDWLNLNGERGPSVFDQRHLLSVMMQYTTGMGVRGGTLLNGWRGTAFKGWTVLSNITKGSGLPLNPIYVSAVGGTGVTGSIRPDFTGADLYAAPSGRFLNPAAVAPPAPGRWGNAGRNSITGPSQFSLNASLSRTFNDGFVEFRLDANNALNTVVFPSWITNINSSQFGLPASANAMRTVQASIRFRFF